MSHSLPVGNYIMIIEALLHSTNCTVTYLQVFHQALVGITGHSDSELATSAAEKMDRNPFVHKFLCPLSNIARYSERLMCIMPKPMSNYRCLYGPIWLEKQLLLSTFLDGIDDPVKGRLNATHC